MNKCTCNPKEAKIKLKQWTQPPALPHETTRTSRHKHFPQIQIKVVVPYTIVDWHSYIEAYGVQNDWSELQTKSEYYITKFNTMD